ncbi:MAG TPA: tyrosine-type recombinase/integrase [Patescibacteria group bacterium]|nr:tyrosine-type recombinase/integrase [Patescibacteria group bacterium]
MVETPKSRLHKFITDFLIYCEVEKNKSQKTIQNYEHYLLRFLDFCKDQGVDNPRDIDLELIRHFRLFLNRYRDLNGKGLKLVTQSYHVIAVRAFLKYLWKRDIETLAPEKIELPKNPSREIHPLDVSHIERMLKAVDDEKVEILRLRDRAILQLLFSSGVRVSEASSLVRKQINLTTGEFTVRGKGDKLRLTFVSDAAVSALHAYMKARHDNDPHLFVSHARNKSEEITGRGHSLSTRSIQKLVKKYSLLAGLTGKVSPHSLRHSFATDLLQNGADIRSVQTLLGHASITTTQIYTHVTDKGLREVHKKFHNKKK